MVTTAADGAGVGPLVGGLDMTVALAGSGTGALVGATVGCVEA